MDQDESFKFYEKFFEEIPYSMAAGASIDIGTTRCGKRIILFERKPFNLLERDLPSILEISSDEISKWSYDYLNKYGEICKISLPPQENL